MKPLLAKPCMTEAEYIDTITKLIKETKDPDKSLALMMMLKAHNDMINDKGFQEFLAEAKSMGF